jgi:hypothetical protein
MGKTPTPLKIDLLTGIFATPIFLMSHMSQEASRVSGDRQTSAIRNTGVKAFRNSLFVITGF